MDNIVNILDNPVTYGDVIGVLLGLTIFELIFAAIDKLISRR